ncbi:family 10 glycosylhydrolase [Paenibacillus motobuensis]|uniref:family 10 glycosylhydrolase n=1 Tax=Paenibacillus TaxID=44249 RepID=UPI00203E3617|nr:MULTISPECIES: family 10 glycosylhydrolase [Paenibacillus]MCM3038363.1 family 10 glycosylhydrolase [Paenibacillus lutimineralis]MCM3645467.1 family 10 glycosylhydrolase [Paenibacillus motobuensis]
MINYSSVKRKLAMVIVLLLLLSLCTNIFVSASQNESNSAAPTYAPIVSKSEPSDLDQTEPADQVTPPGDTNIGPPATEEPDTGTSPDDSDFGIDSPAPETETPEDPSLPTETESAEDGNKLDEHAELLAEVSSLEIQSDRLTMESGTSQQFTVSFYDENGQEVSVTDGLEWSADPTIGRIDSNGLFTASSIIGEVKYGYVTVSYGDLSAQALVLIGKIAVVIEEFESMKHNGTTVLSAGLINSTSSEVGLSSDPEPVMYGEHAAKFTYNMSGTSGTSAAYVNLHNLDTGDFYRPLKGNPTKLGVWVYGDQSAHWFRARLRDGANVLKTIDFTTSANFTWSGWKYVTASIPTDITGPLKISDLYLVETKNENKNAGVLYFDRLSVFYSNTDILGIDLEGLTPMKVHESKQAEVYITKNNSTAPELVQNGATFLSSHPEVASVDSNGMVQAHRTGQTTIVALYGTGQPALFELTVTEDEPPLESIGIYGPESIEQGRTDYVKVLAWYANYPDSIDVTNTATITSSDSSIASIVGGGEITGHDTGTVTITAEYNGQQAHYSLEIMEARSVLDKIVLSELKAMKLGEQQQARVTAKYNVLDQYREDLDKDVTADSTYKSSKPSVADINAQGIVTAKSIGATMLTATYQGKSHSYVLVVNGEEMIPKRELRAAWIATVENIDWPAKGPFNAEQQKADFIAILDELKEAGMNAIVMQVKPTADAFYPSKFAPWSKWLTGEQGKDPGYDPLAFMIEEAHKRNLEFHAWFNPYRASMEPDVNSLIPEHPLRQHEDWLLTYGGRLIMDPGIPDTQQYIIDSIMEVVQNYDIDAVHFDDYFYPYPVAGVNFPDDASYSKYGNGMNREDWRRHNVDTLIQNLSKAIKAEKPYVQFGISPFGIWKNIASDPEGSDTRGTESYNAIYADTRKWVQEEWIDYIAPQIYWYFNYGPAAYENLIDWWAKQVDGKKVHLYIGHGAYRIGSDDPNWLDPDQMPNQILFNRNFDNVKGSIFFSTQSLRDNPLGFNDRLQQDLYAYPALVPEMNWLEQSKPAAPTDMTGAVGASGIQLDWQDPQDVVVYYVIYRSVGDQAPDISDPANIYDEVRKISGNHQQFIDHSVEPGKTYTYTITSFNRAHQESDSTQHVTVEAKELEPIQAIEFDEIPALYTGKSHQVSIKAIYKDRTEHLTINDQMEFSSSNPGIATIDDHGLVKAAAAGKTTLTIKYQSLSAVYELTVLSSSTGGGENPGGGTGGGGSGGGSGSIPSTPPSTNPPTDPPSENINNNQDPGRDSSEEPPNVTLSDISGHWAEISIQQAVQQKWINGYNDGMFRPNQPVNREQFAVMLSRALKLEGSGTDVSFADADKIAAWARPHIARVLESSIINGYQDHTFRPNQQINRAEMAAMIVRALGIEPDSKADLPFSDANKIPAWASPYVAAAYHAGIIQGRSNQAFAPKENATRAEAVIMILRMLQYME